MGHVALIRKVKSAWPFSFLVKARFDWQITPTPMVQQLLHGSRRLLSQPLGRLRAKHAMLRTCSMLAGPESCLSPAQQGTKAKKKVALHLGELNCLLLLPPLLWAICTNFQVLWALCLPHQILQLQLLTAMCSMSSRHFQCEQGVELPSYMPCPHPAAASAAGYIGTGSRGLMMQRDLAAERDTIEHALEDALFAVGGILESNRQAHGAVVAPAPALLRDVQQRSHLPQTGSLVHASGGGLPLLCTSIIPPAACCCCAGATWPK